MTARRSRRATTAIVAALLAGCASAPSSPRHAITLHYAQGDAVSYRVDAGAQGSYAQYRFGETIYLTRRLNLDDDRLVAFLQLAQRSNFFRLPADLDTLPEPEGAHCDPDSGLDGGCGTTLDRIVVTSDCGPDSRLRISDGRRSQEVHWSCSLGAGERAIAPLLAAVRALFADEPTVTNAPPVRGWRR